MSSPDSPSFSQGAGHAHPSGRSIPVARVRAAQAAGWLLSGWRLFADQPLHWILLSSMVFALMAIISLLIVPILVFGPMVPPVAMALLLASLLEAAARQARGGRLQFSDIFSGAMPYLGSLALVGVFFAIPLVLLHMLAFLAASSWLVGIFGSALGGALSGVLSGIAEVVVPIATGGAVLLGFWLIMVLVLIFSLPLIVFSRASALDAMSASLRASLRNFGPILLFGLLVYVLFAIALAPFGLGVVVFIPVFVGALRQAFIDMFPVAPATEA